MRKQDIEYLKTAIKNNYILRDFIAFVKTNSQTVKICYRDKVITITENIGFAYLIGWWCDGCITQGQATEINKICNTYNDRF